MRRCRIEDERESLRAVKIGLQQKAQQQRYINFLICPVFNSFEKRIVLLIEGDTPIHDCLFISEENPYLRHAYEIESTKDTSMTNKVKSSSRGDAESKHLHRIHSHQPFPTA